MYFLDQSFFTGDIHIPNLDETCVQNYTFFKLMSKWEKEALELSLGKCLSDDLLSQFEITGEEGMKEYTLKDGVDDKWEFLINGRNYSKDDEGVSSFSELGFGCGCNSGNCLTHNWEGIVNENEIIVNGKLETFKESFLAYYVYFMWCFDNASRTTGTGEQVPDSKNSSGISNKAKRIAAWNYFYTLVRGCQSGGKTGLHIFLKEHSELFDTFEEICFQNQNIYGI